MNNTATTFESFGLSSELMKAIEKLNFTAPSPIQSQAIPHLMQGRDVIGMAQTGTGKTLAFAVPILEDIDPNSKYPQALILTPTRELAIQVAGHIENLAIYNKGVDIAIICGGQDYRPQLKKLKQGANIIVGTPGRVLDHLDKRTLKLQGLKHFVLDEADEMLKMGFIDDVETILKNLPDTRQLALFSATMPPRIRTIAKTYLNDPVAVEIKASTVSVKEITQNFLFANNNEKPNILLRILACEQYHGMIVFVKTKNLADEIATLLQQYGYLAMGLHGDLSQALRERIITQFKQDRIKILVATDVAARGLDVSHVTHVINYDIAHDCETYMHRIGRTGRAGRSGNTILFVTPRETRMLNNIERHIKQKIEKISPPSDKDIQIAKEKNFLQKVQTRVNHKNLQSHKDVIARCIKEIGIDPIELAASLSLLYHNDEHFINNLPEVKAVSSKKGKAKNFDAEPRSRRSKNFDESRDSRGKRSNNARRGSKKYIQEVFRLDVGRKHGVKPRNIIGAIANEAQLDSEYITDLKIHETYSTVNLPKDMSKQIVRELNKAWVCGRQLNLTAVDAL